MESGSPHWRADCGGAGCTFKGLQLILSTLPRVNAFRTALATGTFSAVIDPDLQDPRDRSTGWMSLGTDVEISHHACC